MNRNHKRKRNKKENLLLDYKILQNACVLRNLLHHAIQEKKERKENFQVKIEIKVLLQSLWSILNEYE